MPRTDDRRDRAASGFRYQPRTREELQKRANQSGFVREGFIRENVKIWRPAIGENRIRILPPTWKDANHYGYELYAHYGIGSEGSAFVCLKNPPQGYEKAKCAPCEEQMLAQEAGEEDRAKALRASKRVCVYIIDRAHEADGVQLWPMPYTIDKEIAALAVDPEEDGALPIDAPDEGYDVIFKKEGQNIKTKYTGVKLARRMTPLSDDARDMDDWLDYIKANPLDEVVEVVSETKLAREMEGGVRMNRESDSRDRDDDRRRGRDEEDDRRGSRSRSRDEEDDRGRRRVREDDDRRPSRRSAKIAIPETWRELSDLTEDELIELAEQQEIDLNERRPVAPQIARALHIDEDEPRRGSRREEEDDRAPRRRGREEEDDTRASTRSRREDDEPPARRSRADEDADRPARSRDRDDDPDHGRRRARDDDDYTRPARRGDFRDDDPPPRRARGRDDDPPFDPDPPRRARDDEDRAPRRARTDDDDPPPRRSGARDDDRDPPPRRTNGSTGETVKPARERLSEDRGDRLREGMGRLRRGN
jgi:hypothetical protein